MSTHKFIKGQDYTYETRQLEEYECIETDEKSSYGVLRHKKTGKIFSVINTGNPPYYRKIEQVN